MNNISNTNSNNNQKEENEKNNNLNNVKVNNKKSDSNSKDSYSSIDESNLSIDINNPDNKKTIFPSRTTQIGINFLTQEKEEEIYNENTNEAKKICELIYILLDEEILLKIYFLKLFMKKFILIILLIKEFIKFIIN